MWAVWDTALPKGTNQFAPSSPRAEAVPARRQAKTIPVITLVMGSTSSVIKRRLGTLTATPFNTLTGLRTG